MELSLPADLRIGNVLGEGQRCIVYAGTYQGEPVAVKAYRADMMQKCRRRYGITRSAFEFQRNTDIYAIESLRRFVAKPIALFGEGDGFSHAFVQERIDGVRLRGLLDRVGQVPAETQHSLRMIVDAAHRAGIYDLDLCANNILVHRTHDGWQPLLFDFNMMPLYLFGRSPLTTLLYRFGLRKPWGRDLRHLADFADWPNRVRRYKLPVIGLKIRTHRLNRYEFFRRCALDARPRTFAQPGAEALLRATIYETNWDLATSELSHA